MGLIGKALVDETWMEVSKYPYDKMVEESGCFLEAQPNALSFIMALTDDYGEGVRSLALYLAYVVFRIFEKNRGGKLPLISKEAITGAFEANEKWLESMRSMDDKLLERRIKYSEDFSQPFIIQYVLYALFEEEDDYGNYVNDDSRTVLLIALKIFMDVLDGITEG